MELIKSREGFAPFGPYQTWYQVTGDLDESRTPLVILHGGPGCIYDYVDAYKDVAAGGYPVIHYDRLGHGRSTHVTDMPSSFWTMGLFLEELDNLLEHLGIRDRYALLGQSWGGMLASEHAVCRPAGLRCLVIANSPADMCTWVKEIDPFVHHTPVGMNESHIINNTRDWTIVDRLHLINVPSLLISGRHDKATPLTVKPFLEQIPGIRWALFENSSHMPYVEERVACMGTVVTFLDANL